MPIYRGKRPPRKLSIKSKPLPKNVRNKSHGPRNFSMNCDGGPLHGARLMLRFPEGTLPICMRGHVGHYSQVGNLWVRQLERCRGDR